MVVTEGGIARLMVESVASFSVNHETELRTAVAVDGDEPEWVTFQMGPAESRNWKWHVAENRMAGALELDLEPGTHTIKVYGTDPSINLSRLVLDFGGGRQSYTCPTETRIDT